jgi:hypothetical protein
VIGSSRACSARIVGDRRAQAIIGGDEDDELDSRGGPDVVSGHAGDDTIDSRYGAINAVGCDGGLPHSA